jgi:hypothetical protein
MSEKQDPQRPLPYERPGSATSLISRGQFRWLLILLTIHLLITIQNTYAPGLRVALKEWRANRELKATRAADVSKRLAVEQQALTFSDPPSKVVWEEDPDAAAKLMAGAGYRWIHPNTEGATAFQSLTLPQGAWSLPPPVFGQAIRPEHWRHPNFNSDMTAVAFLHGLRSPGGNERLALVYVSGSVSLAEQRGSMFGNSSPPPTTEAWTRCRAVARTHPSRSPGGPRFSKSTPIPTPPARPGSSRPGPAAPPGRSSWSRRTACASSPASRTPPTRRASPSPTTSTARPAS